MTKAQAKAKYAEDVAKAEAEKAEQERLEKEAEEAKATANTRLLEEIRDTLKALSEKRLKILSRLKKAAFLVPEKQKAFLLRQRSRKHLTFVSRRPIIYRQNFICAFSSIG